MAKAIYQTAKEFLTAAISKWRIMHRSRHPDFIRMNPLFLSKLIYEAEGGKTADYLNPERDKFLGTPIKIDVGVPKDNVIIE